MLLYASYRQVEDKDNLPINSVSAIAFQDVCQCQMVMKQDHTQNGNYFYIKAVTSFFSSQKKNSH